MFDTQQIPILYLFAFRFITFSTLFSVVKDIDKTIFQNGFTNRFKFVWHKLIKANLSSIQFQNRFYISDSYEAP